ncbi:nucleoside phosphatase family-domain-containing protein [Dichotomocladium elegans]|nr:nucleoside phosphatase family-domain-containing protein [Dichotomocladium elegans]
MFNLPFSKRQLQAASTDLLASRQVIADEPWHEHRRYGVVIDAGSTGSRVYVYSWKDLEYVRSAMVSSDELKGRIPVIERGDREGLKWTLRNEPGLSSYANRPQYVGEHLQPLLDLASEVIPPELQSHTPLFLMATAGMRLLPEGERNALLGATCNYIRDTYLFAVPDCAEHIRLISGEYEGIYGWVAVNYLMGGFDMSIERKDRTSDLVEDHHTFGFLDMGGASAQIAFEPEHHQRRQHSNDLRSVTLRTLDGHEVQYDVFVTTFLGYGSNEARRRYLEERIRVEYDRSSNKNLLDEHRLLHLDDPCLPPQLNVTDSSSTSVPLSLHGTGSFTECMELTASLLNKDADCPVKPCLFNGVHTPMIDWSVNKFVGISEYWYSSNDLLGLGGVYDFEEYEQKASSYCSKPWNGKDSSDLHHRQMQCFKSAWIVNVLHNGIGIPRLTDPAHGLTSVSSDAQLVEQSIESIAAKNWNPPFQSIDTINDIQVSWTLGAMVIYVSNLIPLSTTAFNGHYTDDDSNTFMISPASSSNLPLATLTGRTSALVVALMVVVALFLWCVLYKKKGYRKRRDMGAVGGILGRIRTNSPRLRSRITKWMFANRRRTTPIPPTMVSVNDTIVNVPEAEVIPKISMPSSETDGHIPAIISGSPASSAPAATAVVTATTNTSTNNGTLRPTLGISTLSASEFSAKYWDKKRYSGDSHDLSIIQKHFMPSFRGAPSSSNLAIRATSNSNNTPLSPTSVIQNYPPV